MTEADVLDLLGLLEARGVVAWVTYPDQPDAFALMAEADGADSVLRLLVSRGFAVVQDELPASLRLRHPSGGDIEVHPVSFRPDGAAVRHLKGGGTVTIPASSLTVAPFAGGSARQVRIED
ncbi:MAG: hypothetical protein KY461_04225 [Actinobacteria bacterium]|nr:hypothetical protein [Actinomycetota bacterium]